MKGGHRGSALPEFSGQMPLLSAPSPNMQGEGENRGKKGGKGGKGGKRDGTWVNFRNFGHFCIGEGGGAKNSDF